MEVSPVKSRCSNGRVMSIYGMVVQLRAMFVALQNRIGKDISPKELIINFMPEYAAYLLNRLKVGRHGKTAYESSEGKSKRCNSEHSEDRQQWNRQLQQQ